jgi:hypothetical protein
VESDKHCEHSRPTSNHCLRRSGTERAWFWTREEAERFAASPANPAYRGDIAHLCGKCGFYHLSRPEWLEPKFTSADLQSLEDAGIETPPRLDEHFRCFICGSVMRDGVEFLIMPNGSVRCVRCCACAAKPWCDCKRPRALWCARCSAIHYCWNVWSG